MLLGVSSWRSLARSGPAILASLAYSCSNVPLCESVICRPNSWVGTGLNVTCAYLSCLHFPLGIEGVTHPHHVGGLGKIVFALWFVAAVKVLSQAIEELIRDVSFNLQAQLSVDKRPLPRAVMFGGACCCGEVEVEVKGICFLF